MSADMDPNDHDTVHYGIIMWMFGIMTKCETNTGNELTTTDWDKVTCRLCAIYRELAA